jgi:lipid-A-disaccharide synthase
MARQILVSAGEASGDVYAALLVKELRRLWPDAEFFGCTGPRLRDAGVRTVVDAHDLAVVGLVEVLGDIPRIYNRFRRIVREAERIRPQLAILTDSPDFNLRLARKLKKKKVDIVYLVAPQVWAWRKGRLPLIRRTVDRLICIFPFEEAFFHKEGVAATYVGHPLSRIVRPFLSKTEFFRKHRIPSNRPLVTVLPGSRKAEAGRHISALLEAVDRLNREQAASFVLPASPTTGAAYFQKRIGRSPIQVIEGETWDAIAHADVALAASGTVTVEAALLGTPMVTFYKVTGLSWLLGRFLVDVPFYSMVNLIAGRAVVPELMQSQMTGDRLASEVLRLLTDGAARARMVAGLAEIKRKLSPEGDPIERAGLVIQDLLEGKAAHVS